MTVLGDAISDVMGGLASVLGNVPADNPDPPSPAPSQPAPPQPGPPPPAPAPDAQGDTAKALTAVTEAQNHASTDVAKADEKLAEVMLQATAKSQQGKDKLHGIQKQIADQIDAAGPTPWSPSTETKVAEFMQSKIGDIKDVLSHADLDSKSLAAAMDALGGQYAATAKPSPNAPAAPAGAAAAAPAGAAAGAPAAPAAAPADELGALGGGDGMGGLGGILPGLEGGLGQIPGSMGGLGGMMPGMMGGGMPGMGGGLDGLRDPESHHSHHHADDDEAVKPLKDPSSGSDGAAGKPADSKPDPLKDPAAAATPASTGSTPAGAAPAAANQPAADTSVALPGSSETRQAASPAIAQAVRDVIKGTDIDTAYTGAHLQLPPVGTLDNAPVDQSHITLGTVGQFTDHRVVAMSGNDVLVNGQVIPIGQLDIKDGNFLGWVKPTPAQTSAPAT